MIFFGLFFIGGGIFALFQARLPRAERKIFPIRSNGWPWQKKDRKPLGRYSCIGSGIFFSVAGVVIFVRALHLLPIDDAYFLLGSIPLFLVMIAGAILDGVKTEPNQAPEPTPTAVTPPAGQEARQP